MEIDKIKAKIRPRSNWEAVDLGFAMARKWWKPIYLAWVVVTLPIFLLLCVIFYNEFWLAILVFWWMKPIFDKIVLYIVSRELFAEEVRLTKIISLLPSFIFKHIIKFLTFYRLSPSRSFNLPVWQLEGLTGDKRATRALILKRDASNNSISLILACLALELVVNYTICYAIVFILPSYFEIHWVDTFNMDEWSVSWIAAVGYYLAVMIIEPFYVCAGFATYLNRRTALEAWDIELAFRNLSKRIKTVKYGGRNSSVILVFLVIISTTTLFADSVYADPMCDEWNGYLSRAPKNDAEKAIIEVFSDDEFIVCHEVDENIYEDENGNYSGKHLDKLYPKNPNAAGGAGQQGESDIQNDGEEIIEDFEKKNVQAGVDKDKYSGNESSETPQTHSKKEKEDDSHRSSLDGGSVLGLIIEIMIWVGAIVLVMLLVWQIIKYRHQIFSKRVKIKTDETVGQQELFGMDLRPSAMPKSLPQKVLELWHSGKYEQAVGLLYSGALSGVIYEHGVEISDDMTEGGCQQVVNIKVKKDLAQFFRKITQMWLMTAYAHRKPSSEMIEEVCHNWPQYFRGKHES